jgi:glutamine synthetase
VKPSGLGRPEFVERYALWTRSQKDRVLWVRETIEREQIGSVRVVFGDQHGIARGKTLTTRNFLTALERGHTIVSTVFAMDTTNHIVFPVFTAGGGLPLAEAGGTGDLVMVPDPETFRVLPWVPKTAWVLADLYLSDGAPVLIAPRHICRRVLSHLHEQGFESMTGLEVEFHIMKLEDARLRPEQSGQPPDPPQVSMFAHGFQHLAELRIDEFQPILETLRVNLEGLGLPIRSLETEWGPSQCEVTFEPGTGLGPADDMLLFRYRGQADLPAPRLSRELYVLAGGAEPLCQWLASASVAVLGCNGRERVCCGRFLPSALGRRPALRRRAVEACQCSLRL